MLMHAAARPEVLSERDREKEHCGNPSVDVVQEEFGSHEQRPAPGQWVPVVPDEDTWEILVDGAGI
jgi:hypothetical protein